MISAILSILGSSAFGSLLGGIFAFLNRKNDLEQKRLDLDQERARWAHELVVKDKDLEYARAEAAARKDVAVVEGEATVEAARFAAVAVAQGADRVAADEIAAAGKLGWVLVLTSAALRLVRPGATLVLGGAAVYVNLLLVQKLVWVWPNLTPVQQIDTAMQAFAWITGQASAALGYWFVARGSVKK